LLTAAVRRVRKPGCKFDEMVILEQETQGTDKSTALATLAVHDEWFSDLHSTHFTGFDNPPATQTFNNLLPLHIERQIAVQAG
jgi:predicted P-loop ATPase